MFRAACRMQGSAGPSSMKATRHYPRTTPATVLRFLHSEMVWNDSVSDNKLSATGGGASGLFAKPSWQTGTGVPADGFRDVPDIAINASPGHDGYLTCVQFIPQGGTTYTLPRQRYVSIFRQQPVPSAALPSELRRLGSILVLRNQATSLLRCVNANYILYPLVAISRLRFTTSPREQRKRYVPGTPNCPSAAARSASARGPATIRRRAQGTIE